MLVKLLLLCNTIGLAKLVEHSDHRGHHDGSVHSSKPRVYETSAYPQRTPLSHQEGYWEAEGLREDTQDYPSSVISSHQEERGDFEAASPQSRNGNWCSFTQSRLVTYIEACMKEKYIVNSQQPCPNGTPDCQKIMYRTALKPVYQVKQKVLKSLQWKCCPGFIGKDCEQHDPNFIPVPGTEIEGGEEEFSNHMSTSVDSREMFEVIQNHEALLDDLQSDIHQAVSNLGDLQRLFENNGTSMVLEVNQSNSDPQERLLQQVLFPHVENFLRKHFNPMWASFNRSLQNLSNIVRNLSHDVEANKRSIERFRESSVPKKEFQELGTKFESKVQENIVRADQVKRDIENQLHMQQANIHYNLSMIKADTDTKLKKIHKIQQSHFLALNNSIAKVKQDQNDLENKLETLERNLTELSLHHGPKYENSQTTIRQINDILAGHAKQLKELYMESDVAFQNIAILERWFTELKKNISKYRPEDLTITLTEKSVIMEENNAAMERQISEFNYTLSNLQENYSDLLRYMEECNCQRISSDTDVLEEDSKNITYSLEDTQSNLKDTKHLESVLRDLLRNEIEELSSAIPSIHLSLSLRQEENRQLQSQVTALSEDIGSMKKKDEEIHRHIKYLNSSFGSLLEDAMRHEVALEALLKEEFVDVLFEDDFSILIPSVFELQESLRHISDKLQEQNVTLESLTRRSHLSERGQQNNHDARTPPNHPREETQTPSTLDEVSSQGSIREHMEPNYEAAKDDSLDSSAYNDIMTLKNDIKHLSLAIKSRESRSDVNLCCNHTIANVIEPLNSSVGILSADLATIKRHLDEHLLIFKKLFGSNEELVASKISLDVTKIQSMLNRKEGRQQKGQDKQRDKKRPEKHRENMQAISGRNTVHTELLEKDSLVAFHVGFSEGKDKEKTVRFNETYFNYGNSYFPEHGHFKAPHKGIYLFVISVEFSSGPALGQLSFSRGYKRTLSSSQRKTPNGNTVTTFAMAEMEKGETVSFELLQGSVVKRSPPGTTMGGFLISKT
ncbi:PREDICTED: multimerin-2 isoform X1 [Lepidothrix coronata]|uniref:Multimerin-2 isoform X1 n=1 Tax=Lepidothrix coronata TaxID=321398 RepID=A0A6J0GKR1_9PASS|nr:PREDICTED: multimerin-2 isoform X1 [Lepidothrix coronata]